MTEIKLERIYNVPLRKEFMKTVIYKRTMKAIKALRKFLQKHMKCENVKIGRYANMELHKGGRKHPPHHIKVKAVKTVEKIKGKDIEIVRAELVGAPEEKKKEEVKKESKKEEVITTEKKDEEKIEKKEKEDKEKEKILEKGIKKKRDIESKFKIKDIRQREQQIIRKDEKPIHEGVR